MEGDGERNEAAGKLRFTHLEAFWMRLRRLGAAGASRSPGRAELRAGQGRAGHPRSHRPASGPASAPQERGGRSCRRCRVSAWKWAGGPSALPPRRANPEPGLPEPRNLGRGEGTRKGSAVAVGFSLSPLRWLFWGEMPPRVSTAGFARGDTHPEPRERLVPSTDRVSVPAW